MNCARDFAEIIPEARSEISDGNGDSTRNHFKDLKNKNPL